MNVAARGCGVANRAFELGIAYAQQRETFGKKIAEHQAVLFRLAEMATKVEAAHAMMVKAARVKDKGERNDLEAGMAKYLASRVLPAGRRGLVPHPWRLRLLQGVRDRAALPRGADAADRRGHRRHPADDHRPAAARGLPPVTALTAGMARSPARLIRDQAAACAHLGSPMYAELLERLADDVERGRTDGAGAARPRGRPRSVRARPAPGRQHPPAGARRARPTSSRPSTRPSGGTWSTPGVAAVLDFLARRPGRRTAAAGPGAPDERGRPVGRAVRRPAARCLAGSRCRCGCSRSGPAPGSTCWPTASATSTTPVGAWGDPGSPVRARGCLAGSPAP